MTDAAIARIRRLYHETTARTIERDLREAIALLKTLGDEATRARAAVYMDGLSQMRSEWRIERQRKTRGGATRPPKRATAKKRQR